jgi:CspA family cold shock protein
LTLSRPLAYVAAALAGTRRVSIARVGAHHDESHGISCRFGRGVRAIRAVEVEMAVGKVKRFYNDKGFGFIKQSDGPDVFVHYTQIEGEGRKQLFENDVVEFEIKEGPKGLQALNVRRVDTPAA